MQFWTNVATLVTAVAALFAILEMRWQRKGSYRPDLVVTGFPFRIHKLAEPGAQLELITDSPDFAAKVGMAASPAHIRCINVGTGQAKRLTFQWSFDARRIVEAIAEFDVQRAAAIFVDDQSVHFGTEDLPLPRAAHFLRHQLRGMAPALSSSDALGLGVAIPYVYSALLGEYFAAVAFAPAQPDRGAVVDIEPLQLAIEYFDIGDSLHRKSFVVIPQLVAAARLGPDQQAQELDIAHGYLEVTETS